MKGLIFFLCSILIVFSAVIPGTALNIEASLTPGLDVISASSGMVMSAIHGNPVIFSAEDFKNSFMIEEDFTVTVLSLPEISEGILKTGTNEVYTGQLLTARELDNLRFIPNDDCTQASFLFTFDGMYKVPCSLRFTNEVNFAPEPSDTREAWTTSDVMCAGYFRAIDPEGDKITYEVVTYPKNGIVTVDLDGAYVYTPYADYKGTDSFTYRARDEYGNYSDVSSVSMKIEKATCDLVFADMESVPSHAAAISVVSDGIMNAREVDGEYMFDPNDTVSRLDFLVSVMDAFGANNIPTISATNFSDDSRIPKEYKGYVSTAAALGLISGTKEGVLTYFEPDRAITCEEAAVILNRILGITTDEDTPEVFGKVSEWAKDHVAALCDAGITDPYTDFSCRLDRASCAGMICGAKRFFD